MLGSLCVGAVSSCFDTISTSLINVSSILATIFQSLIIVLKTNKHHIRLPKSHESIVINVGKKV